MMNTSPNLTRRGEIHWVDYNYKTQRGREIKKSRPSLVVSNDTQNEFDDQITVAPLTSDKIEIIKNFWNFYYQYCWKWSRKTKQNSFKSGQTIDKAVRLKGFMGIANTEIIEQVNKALKLSLDLE